MTMTQTHGYWELTGETEPLVYFDGYNDLDTYSGVDCKFLVSVPMKEDLEDYEYDVVPYAAEGHFRNGIAEYSSIIIPREDVEFLEDLDLYSLRYPSVDLLQKLERLEPND
jgi:hypothetical protein